MNASAHTRGYFLHTWKHFATVRDRAEQTCHKVTDRAAPVHTKKAHRASGEIPPLILYLDPKWTGAVTPRPSRFNAREIQINKTLGGAPEPAWTFW
jgi:hypothetical protein